MKIDILTLFPSMFKGPFDTSMLKKAQDNRLVEINIHDLRQFGIGRHRTVDDRPYGGGPGMVIRVDVVDKALNAIRPKVQSTRSNSKIILLSPQGEVFNQKKARELVKNEHIILIAGHYEGFDHRIREHLVDEELSIGKYVLTGGEIPAMVITDAVVRLIPGVLEKEAREKESFYEGDELDYPQYTKPDEYSGWKVPEILKSGHHAKIEKWREEQKKKK